MTRPPTDKPTSFQYKALTAALADLTGPRWTAAITAAGLSVDAPRDPLDLIDLMRRRTPPRSNRSISRWFTAHTGIPVSHEIVRRWWATDPRCNTTPGDQQ